MSFRKIYQKNIQFVYISIIVGISFCTLSCQHYHLGKHHHHKHHHHYHPHKRHKHKNESLAIIRPINKSQVKGYVRFKVTKRKEEKAQVIVGAEIKGLTPGKQYGFHIHQYGDCTHDGQYAGAHFNPHHRSHGLPHSKLKHSGDMGNLLAQKNGIAVYKNVLNNVYISHLVGRSVIVHAMRDDGISQPSGNAGPYIACGVIGHTPSEEILNQQADAQEDELSLEEDLSIDKKSSPKGSLTVIKSVKTSTKPAVAEKPAATKPAVVAKPAIVKPAVAKPVAKQPSKTNQPSKLETAPPKKVLPVKPKPTTKQKPKEKLKETITKEVSIPKKVKATVVPKKNTN